MLHSQARDGLIFGSNVTAQWRKPQLIIFSAKCCPNATCRRSRGCLPLKRFVVDDLSDLLREPNPLPEIKASVATALTPYIDRPGDRRDGCRLSSSSK